MLVLKDDINEFLNSLYGFLNFDRALMDNIFTTIVYIIYIIICVKHGANWIVMLIGYLIISTIFEFLGISSFLNVISLLNILITSIIDVLFAPIRNFFNAIIDGIKSLLPW